MPAGRPSTYSDTYPKQAEKLCRLGATDQEIADFFEVSIRTVYQWKLVHEEFAQALKAGKEEADARVERSLFQRAIGYEQDEVKIFMPAGAEEPVYAPYRAKIAPDTTACIFWLKNRRPDNWRDKREHEHSGPDGGAMLFRTIYETKPD
ncbi:MAG TPA: terminase [Chiayiivirga sp.]|nr:terminase [Chiayiivirga sp.]